MTEVEYTEQAIDHPDSLDPAVAERILDKVTEATDRTEHRLDNLQGYPYYKLRVGDYRVIVD